VSVCPARWANTASGWGAEEENRALLSFPQWKLQRPLDWYQGLDEAQRGPVNEMLDKVGGREAMQMTIPRRVKRENNRLVPE